MFFNKKNFKCIVFFFLILPYSNYYIQPSEASDAISVIDKIKKEHKIILLDSISITNLNLKKTNFKKIQSNQKKLIIKILALWCAPCIKEIPDLKIISEQIKNFDYKVIYINQDSKKDYEKVIKFVEKNNLNKESIFLDPNKILSKTFQLRGIPTTFIADKFGNVNWRIEGIINSKDKQFIDWLKN